jgi:hypothetical protein
MRLEHHLHPLESPVMLQIASHPYVHGGGIGIATEILADPFLAKVLEILEPDRFQECDRILDKHHRVLNAASARDIALAMENSPVLAALAQFKLGVIPLEWDLWLNPQEPQSLDKAFIGHGSLFPMLFRKFPFASLYFLKSAPSVVDWVNIYREASVRFNALCQHNIEKIPSICLDIKSSWSTADDINSFIQSLKKTFQIDVGYVGSFSYRQIAQINGPKPILFCHGVWDLKQKVESGYFLKTLMLNGADLEEEANLETLRKIAREKQLEIGIYIQEAEAETNTIQRLINLINSEQKLFKLGFALGNSRDGKASRMIKGSGAGRQKLLLTSSILIKMQRVIMQIGLFVRSFLPLRR